MKIITEQLANKLPRNHKLLYNQSINPQDHSTLYSILTKAQQLTIYDITITEKHPQGTIFSVNDHINRTGKNPLIGRQKELDIDFIDISRLYFNEQNSVITDCCGKELNRNILIPVTIYVI